jgi:hypothetical protein
MEEALYASLWIWVKYQSDAAIAHGGDYSLVACLSLSLYGLVSQMYVPRSLDQNSVEGAWLMTAL